MQRLVPYTYVNLKQLKYTDGIQDYTHYIVFLYRLRWHKISNGKPIKVDFIIVVFVHIWLAPFSEKKKITKW